MRAEPGASTEAKVSGVLCCHWMGPFQNRPTAPKTISWPGVLSQPDPFPFDREVTQAHRFGSGCRWPLAEQTHHPVGETAQREQEADDGVLADNLDEIECQGGPIHLFSGGGHDDGVNPRDVEAGQDLVDQHVASSSTGTAPQLKLPPVRSRETSRD
jgi:hypothetical protein